MDNNGGGGGGVQVDWDRVSDMRQLDCGWHHCLDWGTLEGDSHSSENHSEAVSSRGFSSIPGVGGSRRSSDSPLHRRIVWIGCLWGFYFAFLLLK